VVTGTTSGTAIQTVPLYGSAEQLFAKGADSLKLTSLAVAFLCDLPEADPDGAPVECELAGVAYRAATATPLTAVLTNTQATY